MTVIRVVVMRLTVPGDLRRSARLTPRARMGCTGRPAREDVIGRCLTSGATATTLGNLLSLWLG